MKDWEFLISDYVIKRHNMEKKAGLGGTVAAEVGEAPLGILGKLWQLTTTGVAPVVFGAGAVPGGLWWILNKDLEMQKLKHRERLFKIKNQLAEMEEAEK